MIIVSLVWPIDDDTSIITEAMSRKLVVWTNGQWIQYHVWLTVLRNIATSYWGIVSMHWHHPKFVHAVSFFAPFGVDGLTYVFFARDGELGTAAHRRNECAAARAIAAVRQLRLLHIATQCNCGSKCCFVVRTCQGSYPTKNLEYSFFLRLNPNALGLPGLNT